MINNTNYQFSKTYSYLTPTVMSVYTVTIKDSGDNIVPVSPTISPSIPTIANAFNVSYTVNLSAGVYNINTYYQVGTPTNQINVSDVLIASTWTDIEGNYLAKTGNVITNEEVAKLILSLQTLLPCFDYTDFTSTFDRIALDEGLTLLLIAQKEAQDPTNPVTPLIGYAQGDTVYKYSPLFRGDFPDSKSVMYQKQAQQILSRFPCFKEYYSARNFYSLVPTTGGLEWCTGGDEFA